MAKDERLDIDDIAGMIRRRKYYIILPFILITALAIYIAYTLPPVYEAKAKILVERQEIPSDIVETTVTGYVDERIALITNNILTDENLWKIAEKLDLYPKERNPDNITSIVNKMRSNIKRQTESVDISTFAGRKGSATISFTIAFRYNEPKKAQDTANALAALFVAESQQGRIKQAKEVAEFIEKQKKQLKEKIDELEGKLAEFKRQHANSLPGMTSLNMKFQERTESELESVRNHIAELEQRKAILESELAGENPYEVSSFSGKLGNLGPEERLSQLRSRYISASATYSPNHPDLVRMRREIKSLEAQLGGGSRTSRLIDEYEAARKRLSTLKQRYSDEYPDVKRMKKKVAALQRRLNKEISSSVRGSGTRRRITNPRYVTLKSQLDSVNIQLRNERKKPALLKKKLEEYEKRLMQAPQVEKEYLELTRDYENATAKYKELSAKQHEAELAKTLESSSKGERFVLSEPAKLPTSPIKPNRPAIIIVGLFFALGTGAALASVAEYYDKTIHGGKGVRVATGAPPLASIPRIGSDIGKSERAYHKSNKNNKKQKEHSASVAKVASILLLFAILVLVAAHYFYKPIDQLLAETAGEETSAKIMGMVKSIDHAIGQNLGNHN